jgi:hypothetical protein
VIQTSVNGEIQFMANEARPSGQSLAICLLGPHSLAARLGRTQARSNAFDSLSRRRSLILRQLAGAQRWVRPGVVRPCVRGAPTPHRTSLSARHRLRTPPRDSSQGVNNLDAAVAWAGRARVAAVCWPSRTSPHGGLSDVWRRPATLPIGRQRFFLARADHRRIERKIRV